MSRNEPVAASRATSSPGRRADAVQAEREQPTVRRGRLLDRPRAAPAAPAAARRAATTTRRREPYRSCSAASVPSCTTRPWSMTTRRRQSRSMSARSWVVSTTVVSPASRSSVRNAAHGLLAHHVQPDGRLVEEEHLRPVQQRDGQLAAHPLAERELAHRSVQERVQLQLAAQPGQPGRVVGRPAPARCGGPARTSPAAAGPTTAGERWPKTTPIRAASRRRWPPAPARTPAPSPPLGISTPVSIFSVVDLPAPFGPR